MKPFKTFVAGVVTMGLLTAFATTTLAQKTLIADEELDEMTAAGQPKIAQAHTLTGSATAVNFQVNVFAAHIGGQEELTALTLNNIFGENQIANGVNIQSGSSNSGIQTNNAMQSWGSAKVHDSTTVAGVPGGIASCETLGLIAKCTAVNGNGAQGKMGLLWEFADEIADSESEFGPATSANVVVTIIAAVFDEFAQSGLTALTVNNVFGFNQVTNSLNISAGGVSANPGISGASVGSASNQTNVVDQYRGSPYKWEAAPTFSNLPDTPDMPP